jgi:hypothetical protein
VGQTEHPREDAFEAANAWAHMHPDETIGVYPIDADDWAVIGLRADGSAVTSVFTRGPLAPAMLEAARWSGQIAVRGHDPNRVTYRPHTETTQAEHSR